VIDPFRNSAEAESGSAGDLFLLVIEGKFESKVLGDKSPVSRAVE
jgi:hypothetical protein